MRRAFDAQHLHKPRPFANLCATDAYGKVDSAKLNALIFDQFQSGYYVTGDKVGQAWNAGKPLMQKR